ncbi:MAG: ATP-binding protein [Christensenella sp.]
MAANYRLNKALSGLDTGKLGVDVEQWGCENRLSPEAQYTLQLAIEELVTNIVKYGVHTEFDPFIGIEIHEENGEITLTVSDNTAAFNPLTTADPDITQTAEERTIGGLGLFLIRKKVLSIDYEYKNGLNVVRTVFR